MAQGVILKVKNGTEQTISAGRATRIIGLDNITKEVLVSLASAGSDSTLPSVGVVIDDIPSGQSGTIRSTGLFANIDTSLSKVGDSVFVGSSGVLRFGDIPFGYITQNLGVVVDSGIKGSIYLFPSELNKSVRHPDLSAIGENDHHEKDHENRHRLGGDDELNHNDLSGLEADSHIQYILSDGSRAFTGPIVGNEGVVSSGATFPSNPSEGTRFYRSDLNESFTWTGEKWLGDVISDGAGYSGTIAGGGSDFLFRHGVQMDNTGLFVGLRVPFDITIVRATARWTNSGGTAPDTGSSVDIFNFGNEILSIPIVSGSVSLSSEANVNVDDDGVLSFRFSVVGTGNIGGILFALWYRRRAS